MSGVLLNTLLQLHLLFSIGVVGFVFLKRRIHSVFHRTLVTVNSLILFMVFAGTLALFLNDRFDFHYVWSHSSTHLSVYYKIAGLWEGQEGSLLLWAVFQNFVSLILLQRREVRFRLAGALLLGFQISLLLPLTDFPFRADSNALFVSLVEKLDLQPSSLKANWLMKEGKGINPLLQNFWMTIHPPFIFIAFAISSMPYAIAICSVAKPGFDWIGPASRWMKCTVLVLTIGILLGAYWAYETLNFGGYWSWDPVENAIYIPWLIGLAALHVNWLAQRDTKYLSVAYYLNVLVFISIVYATFLTRSGVLGDVSVHAFLDDGYYGYFLGLLLLVTLPATVVGIFLKRRLSLKESTVPDQRTDYAFLVSIVLTLAAFQVFVTTSVPVFSDWLNYFGISSNLAPPVDAMLYSRWQGIFSLALVIFLFRSVIRKRADVFIIVIAFTGLGLAYLLGENPVDSVIVLLLFCFSGIVMCVLLWLNFRSFLNNRVSGSALAHLGFVVLLAGILFSHNLIGFSSSAPQHELVVYQKPNYIFGSQYSYHGKYLVTHTGHQIDSRYLKSTLLRDRFILKDTFVVNNTTQMPGTIVKIKPYDFYYQLRQRNKKTRYFMNHVHMEDLSSYFITPDIEHHFAKDIFLHISNIRDDQKIVWKAFEIVDVDAGEPKSDARVHFKGLTPVVHFPGITMKREDRAFLLHFETESLGSQITLSPVVVLNASGEMTFTSPDSNTLTGLKIEITNWTDEGRFSMQLYSADPDYITIKVEEKPLINLFWSGGLLILLGVLKSLALRQPLSSFRVATVLGKPKKIELSPSNAQSYGNNKDQSASAKTV